MRKAWVYQRKNRPGWYVGWYDSGGKKRSKRCPNKSLADRFARRIEHRYNEDLYPDPVATPWDELFTEYLVYKETFKSLVGESLRSIQTTLTQFKELHGPVVSTKVDERLVNAFIAHRLKSTGSKATVNKDLRNLRAFVRWSVKNRYMGAQAAKIDWSMQKEPKRPVKALTKKQLANLLIASKKYQRYGDSWYIRVLLAVSSGLREGDIERLCFSDIDFESATVSTFSKKTSKGMPARPLHPKAVTELSKYFESVPEGQNALFTDRFTSGKWKRIRENAGLPNLTFHDLRNYAVTIIMPSRFTFS